MNKPLTIFALLFVISYFAFTQNIVYHYPMNNTNMHSVRTPIILRVDQPVQLNDIISKITVFGSYKGKYNFDASISSDNRTITITPKKAFNTNEKIDVTFGKTTFSFHTTSITPEQQLNLFIKNFSEDYPELSRAIKFSLQNKSDSENPLSDTVPADFPSIIINKSTNPSEGYIYIANFGMGTERSYLMILDNEGKPVKYRKVRVPGFDFKMQPNGLITNNRIIASYIPQGWGWATALMEVMDENLNLLDSVQCDSYYIADFHEFKMLPNGHYLLLSYDPQPIDMSKIIPGGDPNAIVLGSIVQELDESKNVVFQWRSWDYIPITDTYSKLTGIAIDPVHINAVELDYDGNLLISSRHLSEITKISRKTGNIIWRLGGKKNMFTFLNDHTEYYPTFFSYQHDIRRLPNGNITFYDNGVQHEPPHSRAVEYKLNEQKLTAELVWEYRNNPDIFGETMGSTQRLYTSGNTLIGWGGVTSQYYRCVSEVSPEKEVVFELSFPKGASFTTTSYRAYKYPYPPNIPEAVVQLDDIQSILLQQNPNDTLIFESGNISTGVSIAFSELNTLLPSSIKVEKYHYAPLYPKFRTPAPLVNEYKVYIYSQNISYTKAFLKFDLNKYPYSRHWENLSVWHRKFNDQFFYPLTSIYLQDEKVLYCETDLLDGEYIFAMSDIYESPDVPLLHEPRDSSTLRVNNSILFRWTAQGYANGFDLQISKDPYFDSNIRNETSIRSNSFLLLLPPQDTGIYYWRVRARNDFGQTDWSVPFMFKLKFPYIELNSPIGGEVWQKGKTYEISWSHNLNNDFAIILYQNNSPIQYVVDSIYSLNGKYFWTIPDYISEGSQYKIMVQSLSEKDFNAISPDFFSIVDFSSIGEVQNPDIKIFPIPTSSSVTLQLDFPVDEILQIDAFDFLGRKIDDNLFNYHYSENSILVNLENLQAGFYFLNIQLKIGSYKLPLIKVKN